MTILSRGALVSTALACSALAFISAPVPARQSQSDKFPIVNLKFAGLSQFTTAQANAIAGLKAGDRVSDADLNSAADLLAQSGAFEKVSYRYKTDSTGMTVEFDVIETSHVLSCSFENFPWFTNDEINAALARAVPLYGKLVPVSGPAMDQIGDALHAMLQSKSIGGDIEKMPHGSLGHITEMQFRVTGIPILVRKVSFSGAAPDRTSELSAAAAPLIGRDFMAGDLNYFASHAFVDIYRRQGFLSVQFAGVQYALLPAARASETDVAVTFPVQEGIQYHWDSAHWNGNTALHPDDLDRLMGMKAKEVANADKISKSISAIAHTYSAKGYIDLQLRRTEHLDTANAAVSYDFDITEGTQYKMGHMIFTGVPDSTAKKLTSQWQLKTGDIFDGTYGEVFLSKASIPRPANGQRFTVQQTLKRDSQSGTVDVILTIK